ncbi:hypothetical protein P886_2337 [Alteromonadaceae bacterium 2753L.S.0a.02]|nr:hypothetical protein P886_2337 [Alteromonadaceae bacterium 2753L.S.0a.02]
MRILSRKTFNIYSLVAALLVSASVPFAAFADEADEQTEEMTVMGAMKTPVVADVEIDQTADEAIDDIPVAVE